MVEDEEPFKRFESDHSKAYRSMMLRDDHYMTTYPILGVLCIIASIVIFGLCVYAVLLWIG